MNVNNGELKKAGLKATLPRIKILEILESNQSRHMSAETIYRELMSEGQEIGLATIYRVLSQFESAGLIVRHHFEGGHSVYELDDGEHHDHIVCVRCGRVDEFCDDIIEQRQRQIASESGYTVTDHCLNIYGICKECNEIS